MIRFTLGELENFSYNLLFHPGRAQEGLALHCIT